MNQLNLQVKDCDYTNADDLNAVGVLLNAYIDDDMGGGEPLSKLQQLRLVDALNQHPTSIVLLAQLDDEYCGMLIAFENFSTFTVSPMINIHDLIVLSSFRGKGVGRQLLETLINKAEQKKCSRVTLEVRDDNANAQHLYQSLDFGETDPPMFYWRKKMK